MQDTIEAIKSDLTTVVNFDDRRQLPNGSFQWLAPSPQGDIAGALALVASATKSRNGIVTRTQTVIVPIWDGDAGVYKGFRQVQVRMSAPEWDTLAGMQDALSLNTSALDAQAVYATATHVADNSEHTDDLIKGRYGDVN
jgi:hypothetical protein